jgi:very-short-patch-repair endonuclease
MKRIPDTFEQSFASIDKARFWSVKNGEVKPRDVFKSSGKKYLFDCECGHEIEQQISSIISGKWCIYCSNRKLCDDQECKSCYEKSFASSDKAKFWSDKNGQIKPRDVFKSSHKNYYFNCVCGHVINPSLKTITSGQWCGYCCKPSRQLCDDLDCEKCFNRSFASSDKAKFWSDKNEVKPRDVFKSSNKKYYFDCDCGHEIEQPLSDITSGYWCGYCSNPPKKLCDDQECKSCYEKSFASSDKAKFWSDKNGQIKPRDVFKSSHKKYYFDCDCGHEIEQPLSDITSGRWCGYCNGDRLCSEEDCKFCFNKSFASSDKAKFWSDKNELKPKEVSKSSGKLYFFNCDCGHEIEVVLYSIIAGSWCGYCSDPPQKLCDCEKCFNNSFASNHKARFWSDKNEVKPRDVFKSSNNKYLFDCDCGHEIEQSLGHIIDGSWCGYCSNKKLCNKPECNFCFNNSFASNHKARFWSDKNEVKPRDVFKSSNNKYLFDCDCGHEIEQPLSDITSGRWCGYCSKPPRKLCDKKECNVCYEKSFASNDKARFWSVKNGEIKPRDLFKSAYKKYFFVCNKGHHFDQSLNAINSGSWCRYCINKTQQKVNDKLIPYFPTLVQEFKVEWCKNKTYLPFDFVIELYKIIIELDGPQHFIQISNWSSPEEQHNNDKYKMECANKNGYSVIRITQEDVFYDTYDWLSELVTNINWIIESKNKLNIFMGLKDEYYPFL